MSRRSLGTRLVVGIVALVAVLAAAIGGVTVAASHGQLVARLDRLLLAASERTSAAVGQGHGQEPGSIVEILPGQGAGAIGLVTLEGEPVRGGYIGVDGDPRQLTVGQFRVLAEVPTDRRPHTVALGSLGSYRVVATPLQTRIGEVVVLNGLSLAEADATTASLIATIAGVSLGALLLAGVLGFVVVRLALRPLTRVVETAARVSELPLEAGEVVLAERVPDDSPETEVGRVGAALNRLLGKVETSLAARHESEQRLRRFVADASHELRTPLATIRGYAELGRRGGEALPDDVDRSLERIESESRRMSTLVEELMLLARLDAGRDLERESVALGALLVEAVSDAHVAGPGHTWDLELPDTDVEVIGDADRLRQAVGNLLANARIHTPEGTTVTARLETEPGSAVLVVADDGPGIPEELRPVLFERFSRGDDSRSRRAGSTGLGLAIVAAIAHAHGGDVTVSSRPGATEFRLRLPRATGESPQD